MESINKEKGINGNLKEDSKMPQQPAGTQMPIEEGKMPFLKKWWFWAAIGAVVLVIALVFFLL